MIDIQGSEVCFSIFLPALVMGNFLVLNLFLALLLNSFSCEELKSRKEVSSVRPSFLHPHHTIDRFFLFRRRLTKIPNWSRG